jgi:hypothetical protein
MTERQPMNKSSRASAKPLRDLLGKVVGATFARQGFASTEIVTRWIEIVGAEIAAHSEPIKIQWPRQAASPSSAASGAGSERGQEAGTLVLRVEGPAAVEVQHLASVICDRVNRFLGWRAIARVALRQAPLRHGAHKTARRADALAASQLAANLPDIVDDDLRRALARLGAAVKRS